MAVSTCLFQRQDIWPYLGFSYEASIDGWVIKKKVVIETRPSAAVRFF